jgi:hypothetical protein
MQYGGYLIEYTEKSQVKYEGPYSTIEETTKHYEDLKLREPAVSNRKICRLVYNNNNPAWI